MSELRVTTVADVGHVNLRGDVQDVAFLKGAEKALGQALPIDANTMSVSDHRIYWLGPDEWLIVTAAADTAVLAGRVQDALQARHAAVNDLSGGQVVLRVSGANARKLFARGCTLDFHPDAFGPGSCAQSGLGKANVLFGHVEEPDTFDVIVRRSFADYLVRWMEKAGSDLGIEFR